MAVVQRFEIRAERADRTQIPLYETKRYAEPPPDERARAEAIYGAACGVLGGQADARWDGTEWASVVMVGPNGLYCRMTREEASTPRVDAG